MNEGERNRNPKGSPIRQLILDTLDAVEVGSCSIEFVPHGQLLAQHDLHYCALTVSIGRLEDRSSAILVSDGSHEPPLPIDEEDDEMVRDLLDDVQRAEACKRIKSMRCIGSDSEHWTRRATDLLGTLNGAPRTRT